MDISLMTDTKPPAAGSSKDTLAAPDKAVFEAELQEKMAPPGDASPPPPEGSEGALRTEAELQPNADDQSLDQPQNGNSPSNIFSTMLWQPLAVIQSTEANAAANSASTQDSIVVAQAASQTEETTVTSAPKREAQTPETPLESAIQGKSSPKAEPLLTAVEKTAVSTPHINAAAAEMVAGNDKDIEDVEETPEVIIEDVDVETGRSLEAPKPAQEQIQNKAHTLDRPAKALEAVQEARQPIQHDLPVRSAIVKMNLVSETFGNLNVSVKSFGRELEADVQTQSSDLNRALNVHRPDLVQSIESKGLTLSQFDVRQQGQQAAQDQGQNHTQDQPATQEEMDRMARLSMALSGAPTTIKPLVGLVNTLA